MRPMPDFETDWESILARLRVLERKLDDEGRYVSANTVWLAIKYIEERAAQ